MSRPSVSIGLRKCRLFVISTYCPGEGTYIDKDPVFQSSSSDVRLIGANVMNGLGEFVVGGAMPDWNNYVWPAVRAAGLPTWREFERGLRSCVVAQDGEYLEIRGDRPVIRVLKNSTAVNIGNAVLLALGTTEKKEQRRVLRRGD